jgi:hypothetical protein
MLANASVAEWYKRHGRHAVYAKNQDLEMPAFLNPVTSKIPGEPLKLRVL